MDFFLLAGLAQEITLTRHRSGEKSILVVDDISLFAPVISTDGDSGTVILIINATEAYVIETPLEVEKPHQW